MIVHRGRARDIKHNKEFEHNVVLYVTENNKIRQAGFKLSILDKLRPPGSSILLPFFPSLLLVYRK